MQCYSAVSRSLQHNLDDQGGWWNFHLHQLLCQGTVSWATAPSTLSVPHQQRPEDQTTYGEWRPLPFATGTRCSKPARWRGKRRSKGIVRVKGVIFFGGSCKGGGWKMANLEMKFETFIGYHGTLLVLVVKQWSSKVHMKHPWSKKKTMEQVPRLTRREGEPGIPGTPGKPLRQSDRIPMQSIRVWWKLFLGAQEKPQKKGEAISKSHKNGWFQNIPYVLTWHTLRSTPPPMPVSKWRFSKRAFPYILTIEHQLAVVRGCQGLVVSY